MAGIVRLLTRRKLSLARNKQLLRCVALSYTVAVLWFLAAGVRRGFPTANLSRNGGVSRSSDPFQLDRPLLKEGHGVADPWKAGLLLRLDRFRTKCGELCSINTLEDVHRRSHYGDGASAPVDGGARNENFPTVRVPVNCTALLTMDEADAGDASVPYPPPDELLEYYTLRSAIPFEVRRRFRDVYLGGAAKTNIWTREYVDDQIQRVGRGALNDTYGNGGRCMRDKLKRHLGSKLQGASVLVIGSENPWLEAICLHLGASRVTTLEYGGITSHHPQIVALTPHQFRRKAREGTLGTFDGILSHSSLEHSGLGRYGDALNPWGDVIAAARGWCAAGEGAFLALGLPTGADRVLFNGQRVYGKIRWPLVAANWVQVDGKDHAEEEFGDMPKVHRFRGPEMGCGGGRIFLFRKAKALDV